MLQALTTRAAFCRRALVAGEVFQNLGPHVAHFLARTLFKTSLYALDTATWRCGPTWRPIRGCGARAVRQQGLTGRFHCKCTIDATARRLRGCCVFPEQLEVTLLQTACSQDWIVT